MLNHLIILDSCQCLNGEEICAIVIVGAVVKKKAPFF